MSLLDYSWIVVGAVVLVGWLLVGAVVDLVDGKRGV